MQGRFLILTALVAAAAGFRADLPVSGRPLAGSEVAAAVRTPLVSMFERKAPKCV